MKILKKIILSIFLLIPIIAFSACGDDPVQPSPLELVPETATKAEANLRLTQIKDAYLSAMSGYTIKISDSRYDYVVEYAYSRANNKNQILVKYGNNQFVKIVEKADGSYDNYVYNFNDKTYQIFNSEIPQKDSIFNVLLTYQNMDFDTGLQSGNSYYVIEYGTTRTRLYIKKTSESFTGILTFDANKRLTNIEISNTGISYAVQISLGTIAGFPVDSAYTDVSEA